MPTKTKKPDRLSVPIDGHLIRRADKVAASLRGKPSRVKLINEYVETGLASDEAKKAGAK